MREVERAPADARKQLERVSSTENRRSTGSTSTSRVARTRRTFARFLIRGKLRTAFLAGGLPGELHVRVATRRNRANILVPPDGSKPREMLVGMKSFDHIIGDE